MQLGRRNQGNGQSRASSLAESTPEAAEIARAPSGGAGYYFESALFRGNAFVLKPSERDPSVPLRLAELLIEPTSVICRRRRSWLTSSVT
jgi:hypothetical protein